MVESAAENRITKINYNPVLKSVFPTLVGAFTGNFVDTASSIQQVFNGRFYGTLGLGAGWATMESELKPGEFPETPFPFKRGARALLTRGLFFSVIPQILLLLDYGKADLGLYIPFIVGSVGGHAIHRGAKALYDSNLTQPIYRVLRIQDRRLQSNPV